MVEVLLMGRAHGTVGHDALGRWKFLADPDSAVLLVQLVREMGSLAGALGIGLSDRAILPTASICAGGEAEAVSIVTAIGARYRRDAPAHRMSALQDVEAGRPLEVNETLGYACARARELSLRLPQLETFTRLIAATDRARRDAVVLPSG